MVADDVQWFADDGLWRCEWKEGRGYAHWACARFLEGISAVRFRVDIPLSKGTMKRRDFAEGDGDSAEAIDVTIWAPNGRPYSRTTGRHERAH